jgi:hypothetical protein
VIALCALLSVASASAHLWESRAQIEQRYGPPFKTKGYPDRRSYFYAFKKWEIQVKYFNGISEEESYRHRNRAARITDSEVRARITDSEVRSLLAANAAGNWSAEWHNEWTIDTPKGRARARLDDRFGLAVYTENSLKRDSTELSVHSRIHKDEIFTGILTPKQDGKTTELVFRANDLLIQLSWQYLANSRNPSLVPGKTYTLTLQDEDFVDEEDVVAFVTDRDHRSSSELTSSSELIEDSKTYLLVRVQDGDDVVFDRSVCEVHHLKMSEIIADYGMEARSAADAQCAKNFPHYRNFLSGDCVLDPTKKASVYVCPKCVAACEGSRR